MDGVVGLLTACLAALLLSHLSIAVCDCKPSGKQNRACNNKLPLQQGPPLFGKGSSLSAGGAVPSVVAGGTNRSSFSIEDTVPPPAELASAEERRAQRQFSMSGMEAGVGEEGGGVWERWDRWSSSERHVCAAVLASTPPIPLRSSSVVGVLLFLARVRFYCTCPR